MDKWKYISFRRTGNRHFSEGTDCQDSVKVWEDDRMIVAALSDGLGSLKYSGYAASAATAEVCRFFKNRYEFLHEYDNYKDLGSDILTQVVKRIRTRASKDSLPLDEMDCTLAFVLISKTDRMAVAGVLGDSSVCVMLKNSAVLLNDGDLHASGTDTVMEANAGDRFLIRRLDLNDSMICGFILSSDGLENELYTKSTGQVKKPAELYFNAVYNSAHPNGTINRLVGKLTKAEDSPFDDDISIAVLSRSKDRIRLPDDPTWLCSCGTRNALDQTYCTGCYMDFIDLFRDIDFSKQGGKTAFFRKLNMDPDKEKEIAGEYEPNVLLEAREDPVSNKSLLKRLIERISPDKTK